MLPLDGIRVVDFTSAGAGPCCAQLLGDFGADVIKIEPPEGDHSRQWGTKHFGDKKEFSGLYLAVNRNKSGIVLNLKDPEDLQAAQDLIARADVVIESWRPGVADRLGVGYEKAAELKPDIIYCSISGFGQTGPLRERPGFDNVMQAYAGHMSVTGEKGRPSVRSGVSANDIMTSAHGAYGITLALIHRMKTGEGQLVDTSLYESAIHLIGHYIADYTATGDLLGKTGPFFPFLCPYGVYNAKDREFFLGTGNQGQFERFCAATGHEEFLSDPRFASNPERVKNQDEFHAVLMPILQSRTAQEWVDLCVSINIPSVLIENIGEVVEQDQAIAREMLVPTGVEGVMTSGIPIKLSKTPGQIRSFPPSLGADNERVLAGLKAGLGGDK